MQSNKRKCTVLAGAATVIVLAALTANGRQGQENEVLSALKGAYPGISAEKVAESGIEGLYEVIAGGNLLYFAPKGNFLIFGEIWTPEGKSLTAGRRDEIAASQLKDLPLELAVKIGNGSTRVIEFTDPDCPFCRKASQFFRDRKDVTRYVFLYPLAQVHPDSEKKAAWILGSRDREKAYHEVMSGLRDKGQPSGADTGGASILARHRQIAARLGVMGTPQFWVNGKVVRGADFPQLEALLREGGGKGNDR